MTDRQNGTKALTGRFWRLVLLSAFSWSIILGVVFVREINHINEHYKALGRNEALKNFEWITVLRDWGAIHGGVYAPITPATPPNKYLEVRDRDIVTPSGVNLTLINPAYMTRQIFERYGAKLKMHGRLVSLDPLNPDNTADDWEKEAIKSFERGATEKIEETAYEGEPHIRLIRPLTVTIPCLQCHEKQGYKLGDVRGAISITVNYGAYFQESLHEKTTHAISFAGIFILGLLLIGVGARRFLQGLSEQEESKLQLDESRRHLLEAQRIAHVGHWEWEVESGKLTWADEVFRIFGLLPGSVVPDYQLFLDAVHPDDRAKVRQGVADALEGKAPYSLDHRINLPDGSTRMIHERGSVFLDSASGQPVRMVGTVLDITERAVAEEERLKLATAIEQSADAIIVADTKGIITYVNPGFTRMTGYSKEEVIGQTPRILKSGRHDRQFYQDLWATITAGKVWRGLLTNRRKDGSCYEEEMTISPVTDTSGTVINFVAVKNDVTQRRMLARARDHFTAVASHELRTPLTKLGLVKLLLRKLRGESPESEDVIKAEETLDNSIEELDRVVNATLIFNELTRPGPLTSLEMVPLMAIVTAAVETARKESAKEERNVTVSLDLEKEGVKNLVAGNADLYRRVLEETLSNAIKYTPDEEEVAVRAWCNQDQGCVITIRDSGPGVDIEKVDQVFEPYYSLESHMEHTSGRYRYKGGGLGAGMSIARMIMDRYGGALMIENSPGGGAIVTLTFPQERPEGGAAVQG